MGADVDAIPTVLADAEEGLVPTFGARVEDTVLELHHVLVPRSDVLRSYQIVFLGVSGSVPILNILRANRGKLVIDRIPLIVVPAIDTVNRSSTT